MSAQPTNASAMPLDPPRVRVVIPCRNEAGYIGKCLRSMIEADRSGMQVEAWVCDGMSDDGTREEIGALAASHPWIKLVDNPARTTPQAMNLGLRAEGYDVGILLGAHAEVEADFLQANLDCLVAHPEAGCVGGIIGNVYTDASSRRIGAAMGHPFGVGGAHFRTGLKEGEVDTVAFGAYRREALAAIGFVDERLARNQDDELNFRLTRAGWRIILSPRIRSRYFVRASLKKLFRQYWQYGYWKVFVNRLHRTVTTTRQLVPAAFVLFLVAGGALAFMHPLLALGFGTGIALYGIVAIASAFHAADRMVDAPGVLLAFITLHLAYGSGYLRGLLDFIVLGRQPKGSAATSSR
jgi:cellulose synthase/poly-beta-1,6-N-acetylglucosamine synthase-like glycosyltransferase